MKWIFVFLLLVNIALAGYAYVQNNRPHPDANIPDFQMNADKVRIIPEPPPLPQAAPEESTARLEWGTFGDLELRRVRDALSSLELGNRVAARKEEVTANWWVFMPPQRTRALMERKANELVELGVTDFIPLPEEGRWQYAISLGTFREERGAREYLAQLKEQGVRSGDLGRREQQVMQTTLVISAPTPTESTKLVELATRFPGSEMRATQCGG
jgi:hypothetical protein